MSTPVKFVLLSAIWGSSFALIKVAVDAGVPPVWVAFARCLFGAVTLWAMCGPRRVARRVWLHALVVAALLNSVPFTLLALGEKLVGSVVAGVVNATTPLTTLVFALALSVERLTGRRLAGLAIGLCGVLVLLGVWEGLSGNLLVGGLACLGATVCYGAGFAYTRRFFMPDGESALVLSAVQIGCAFLQLAVAAPLLGGAPSWPGVGAMAALVVLGAVGTGFAYVLNFDVIRGFGPTAASTVTYVTPLWSTALGVWLLGESVGWNALVGGVIVLVGVLLTRPRHVESTKSGSMVEKT
ncbi:EamA family transporter [Actinosynnema sp. NPDC020468]|uniref:DMT family transporter n=1 Tax=Actinosynnema sp. NPDC020468 TaxID=3154488 RepID=UPI0033F54489